MIRDRLVLGTRDRAARARLLKPKECYLKWAIKALRISELTYEQLKKIDVPRIERAQKQRAPPNQSLKIPRSPKTLKSCKYWIFTWMGQEDFFCPAYHQWPQSAYGSTDVQFRAGQDKHSVPDWQRGTHAVWCSLTPSVTSGRQKSLKWESCQPD